MNLRFLIPPRRIKTQQAARRFSPLVQRTREKTLPAAGEGLKNVENKPILHKKDHHSVVKPQKISSPFKKGFASTATGGTAKADNFRNTFVSTDKPKNHSAKKGTRKPRFSHFFNLFVLSATFSIVVLWLSRPHTFPVREIQLGNTLSHQALKTPLSDVQATIAPFAEEGFLHLDFPAIETAVLKLPWVSAVKMKRQWPATLTIELQEHEAVAVFQTRSADLSSDKMMLLDERGNIFHAALPEKPRDLPLFVGTANNAQIMLAGYQEFKSLVESANLRIHELGCDARRAWYMVLDNQLKLLLGRGENRTRLERFLNLYPRLATKLLQLQNGGQTLVSVDLRYANGLAVQLAQRQN